MKKYTVEKVSEKINENIRRNKCFIINDNGIKMTYSTLVFDTIINLLSPKNSAEDIISIINKEGKNITPESFSNNYVLITTEEIPYLTKTAAEAYKDFVDLIRYLSKIDKDILGGCILNLLSYRTLSHYSEKAIPDDIAHLIRYFLNQNDCKKVYYPNACDLNICQAFSSSQLLTSMFDHYDSEAQEFKVKYQDYIKENNIGLITDCDMSIYDKVSELLFVHDVIDFEEAEKKKYDSVIGIYTQEHDDVYDRSFEDVIDFCLREGQVEKSAIFIIPTKWFRQRTTSRDFDDDDESNLREIFSKLYKNKNIKCIIELPYKCISSELSYSMLILNMKGGESSIRYINASESTVRDTGGVCLDVESIIDGIITDSKETDILKDYEYQDNIYYSSLLTPHYWVPIRHNGESRYAINELVDIYPMDKFDATNKSASNYRPIQPEQILSFRGKDYHFYDIIINSSKDALSSTTSSEFTRYINAKQKEESFVVNKIEPRSIVLEFDGSSTVRFFNRKEDSYISKGLALRVNKDIITPEYLIYALWEMDAPYLYQYDQDEKVMYDLFLSLPVVIPTSLRSQINLLNSELDIEFNKRLKELSADQDRFGIRTAAADIQHMLGTPFSQQKVCMELIKRSSNEEAYKRNVSALIDISEYIQRIVTSVGADISKADFNPIEIDLAEFLRQYIISYENYSTGYFKVDSSLDNKSKGIVVVDVDMLKLQLDTILDNAGRHGFAKKTAADNKVQIQLDYIQYKGSPYFRISVMNNGKPKNPDYSVSDFISRGNFDGESGRTGLGGYHIHQIAQKHKGFVGIDSNDEWGFIVNVLIPVQQSPDNKKIKFITDDKEYV